MANEIYIALEETSQEIKEILNDVSIDTDTIKSDTSFIKENNSATSIEAISAKIDQVVSILSSDCNALEASDNLLLTIMNGKEIQAGSSKTGSYNKTIAGSFHVDLTGKVRIRTQLKFTSSHGSGHASLYRGDTLVAESTSVNSKNASNYTVIQFDADVNQGNDYSIYVEGCGSAGYSGHCYMNLAEVRGSYVRKNIDYVYKV